ncbi:MAG: hypothetical protein NC320_00115 [Clostridium sp.]|nr:hypothetical protein [Clostridium sp.]MCM1547951.1 hypothetical protein [Ruminococcus sp.]
MSFIFGMTLIYFERHNTDFRIVFAISAVFSAWVITTEIRYRKKVKNSSSAWAVHNGKLYFIYAVSPFLNKSLNMKSMQNADEIEEMISYGKNHHIFNVMKIDKIKGIKQRITYSRVYFIDTKKHYADISAKNSGYDELMDILKRKVIESAGKSDI